MANTVLHADIKIVGPLPSGSGQKVLTVNPITGEVGQIDNVISGVTGDISIDSSGLSNINAGVIVNNDINATAGIVFTKMAALAASSVVVTNGSGFISTSFPVTTLNHIANLTSDAQAQINSKQAIITGAASTVVTAGLTASKAVVSGATGKIEAHPTTTLTEIGYSTGVTSPIQTQLNARLSVTLASLAQGDILKYNGSAWVNIGRGTNGQVLTSTASDIEWATVSLTGIPVGGTANQYLKKVDATDYNVTWDTLTPTDMGVTASAAELNFTTGVTSPIQAQINSKLSASLAQNAIFVGNASNVAAQVAAGSEGQLLQIVGGVPVWQTVTGTGTVTSVDVSGGTTGLSTTGGPISTSGTITLTGTLIAAHGGTGFSTYAVGDILYASTTSALSKLADVATGNALISGGVSTAPSWGKIGLTTHVSGTLPVANGGTGAVTATANTVFSGPTSGAAAPPSFRILVNPDMPKSTWETETGATYSFVEADYNKIKRFTNVGAITLTVPTGLTTGWFTMVYKAAGSGTITIVSSGTLESSGNTMQVADTSVAIMHRGSNAHAVIGALGAPAVSSTATAGQVAVSDGTNLIGSSSLFFDTTNFRLGVGTSSPDRHLHIERDDASSGAVAYVARFTHTANLAVSAGMGVGIEFEVETATGNNNEIAGTIELISTDITAASEDFDMVFKVMNTGIGPFEMMRIKSTGFIEMPQGAHVGQQASNSALIVGYDFTGNNIGGATNPRMLQVSAGNATSAMVYPARFTTWITGAPSAGVGTGIEFEAETATDNFEIGAIIEAITTDVTSTSEDFDLVFKTMAAGAAAAERVRISSLGAIGLAGANYGTSGQVLTSNGSGAAASWTTLGGGGGGITNTAANNEMMKSNGTNAVPSGIFSATTSDLTFGSGSVSGATRTLSATGSASDVGFIFDTKGTSGEYVFKVNTAEKFKITNTGVVVTGSSDILTLKRADTSTFCTVAEGTITLGISNVTNTPYVITTVASSGSQKVGLTLKTGDSAAAQNSGDVLLASGSTSANGSASGSITITSGATTHATSSTTDSGHIIISPGLVTSPNSVRGKVGVGTASPDRFFHVEYDTATTNAVTYVQRLTSTSSGTPATGIGVGVEFEVETAAGNNEIGATIEALTTDVTSTSEDFDLVFKTMTAGAAPTEKLRIKSTGEIKMGALTLGGLLYRNNVTSAANTGTITETLVEALLIPGGTLKANDILRVVVVTSKTGTAGTMTYRVRLHTTNTIAGSTVVSLTTTTTSNLFSKMQREITFKNALNSAKSFNNNLSATTDHASINFAMTTYTNDFANDQYLMVTLENSNTGDSTVIDSWYVEVLRYI